MKQASQEHGLLRIAVAGAAGSTRRALEGLVRHGANIVGVLELCPEVAGAGSGYCQLRDIAEPHGIPVSSFRNINDSAVAEDVRAWEPDLFFVVGLSQLVRKELLSLPKRGCVGYHPTRLPEGRGRAPIAWLALDGGSGAATFFLMDEGADSGPILVQEPYCIEPNAYAQDVTQAQEKAIDRALNRWLPELLAGAWEPQPQDDAKATYNGRRAPRDGRIDWSLSAEEIQGLVRATSRPHPGAYTFLNKQKLIVWRAEVEHRLAMRGVPGRIVEFDKAGGAIVQTGDGLLLISEAEYAGAEPADALLPWRIGVKLGISPEDEVVQLWEQVRSLEERLAMLEKRAATDLD